jgi:hypothetical protein
MAMKSNNFKRILTIGLLSVVPVLLVFLSVCGADPLFIKILSYFGCACYVVILVVSQIKRKENNSIIFVYITYIALMLSVGSINWPLKVYFNYYQEKFEMALSKFDDISLKQEPTEIGLFEILHIEKSGPSYILWIDDSKDGGIAFVKGNDPNYFASIWSKVKLSSEWEYIVFD